MKEQNKKRKPLTIEQKLEIAHSQKSSRELATEMGLHHSTINEIKAESEQFLRKHWEEKSQRQGRPPQEQTPAQVRELSQQLDVSKKENELQEMKIQWLELTKRHADENLKDALRAQGNKLKKKRQAKKKKK